MISDLTVAWAACLACHFLVVFVCFLAERDYRKKMDERESGK